MPYAASVALATTWARLPPRAPAILPAHKQIHNTSLLCDKQIVLELKVSALWEMPLETEQRH